jgi:hypothetical protein
VKIAAASRPPAMAVNFIVFSFVVESKKILSDHNDIQINVL